jgi:hypothetical protein
MQGKFERIKTVMMSNRKVQLFSLVFVCFLVFQALGGSTGEAKPSGKDDLTNKTDAEGKAAASDTAPPWIAAVLKVEEEKNLDNCTDNLAFSSCQ